MVGDYQFQIEVPPYVTFGGLNQGIKVSSFDPGSFDIRSADVDSPIGDWRSFGVDRRTPPVWAWTLWTDAHSPAEALALTDRLGAVWDDAVRLTPGAVVALTYGVAGRRRQVFGRPRRFTATLDVIQTGRVHIAADFALAEDVYYDADEQQVVAAMTPGATPPSGLIIPATVPWRFTVGQVTRTMLASVRGTAPTWISATFYGPVINPWISIGEMTINLTGYIPADQSVRLSGRPWESGLVRSDGAGVPEMLDPRARMSTLRVSPGDYPITYGGIDTAGSSRCIVTWRNAYRSL